MATRAATAFGRRPRWPGVSPESWPRTYRDALVTARGSWRPGSSKRCSGRGSRRLDRARPARAGGAVTPEDGRTRSERCPKPTRPPTWRPCSTAPARTARGRRPAQLERRAADARLRRYRYRWLPRAGGTPTLDREPQASAKSRRSGVRIHQIARADPAPRRGPRFPPRPLGAHPTPPSYRREVVLRFDLEDFSRRSPLAASMDVPVVGCPGRRREPHRLVTRRPDGRVGTRAPLRQPGGERRPSSPQRRLATPHLPQGAPTSPALREPVRVWFEVGLPGLADASGAVYSGYADDIALSGDRRLQAHAVRVAPEESRRSRTTKSLSA